jgi:NADH:ubiquinone oxidoreductase subunit K
MAPSKKKANRSVLVFSSQNYLLMAASVALIVIGFVAMYLDGQFLGVVSLTVSPILIVAGYGLLIYAILQRSDDPEAVSEET